MKNSSKQSKASILEEPCESPSIIPNNTDITTVMSSDTTNYSPTKKVK